jgi:hypothetical protein
LTPGIGKSSFMLTTVPVKSYLAAPPPNSEQAASAAATTAAEIAEKRARVALIA